MKLEQVCQAPEEKSHTDEIESLVAMGDRLFSAADDGFIKVWSTKDLSLLHEFRGHDYAINHLLVFKDRLYSASMDGTIKSWEMDTWTFIATFTEHEDTPRRLATDGQFIFSGDDQGNVIKWTKDGEVCAKYELVEEVWDLCVKHPHIYTIRDRGMTITEIKGTGSVSVVVRTVEGRAPIYIGGEDMLILDRSGTVVNHFRQPPVCEFVKELKGHEHIITAMGGCEDYLLTSGYDEKLFLWSISSGKLLHSMAVTGVPKVICVSDQKEIFVGGPIGSLVKIKIVS